MFCAGAEKIDLSNLSAYDQGCNEEFQNAMKNYFEGTATKEEALDLFYKAVVEKYRHRILRQGQLGWLFEHGDRRELQYSAANSSGVGDDFG